MNQPRETLYARLFHADDGGQEYHLPDMAQWLANLDGAGGRVVQFLPSEEAGKEGLIAGYLYRGPQIETAATVKGATVLQGGGQQRMTSAGPAAATRYITVRPASRKRAATLSAEEFAGIRAQLKLTAADFGRLLGYSGADVVVAVSIYRFEGGARPVPPAVARLATMYARKGVPRPIRAEAEDRTHD